MAGSEHRLWRKDVTGYYQIMGSKEVVRPEGVPLKMPKFKFNLAQRQVIIDWFFGKNSDFS